MDYRYEADESARDFHRDRRAFVIYHGELLFLPQHSPLSHYEYCQLLGINKDEYDDMTRGYFKDGKLCFYTGNFTYDDRVMGEAFRNICEIATHLHENIIHIYFGALPDQDFELDYYYGFYIYGEVIQRSEV